MSKQQNVLDGAAKVWINFNGENTPSIRNSQNASSITDLGQGLYQPNYTNAFSAADYAATATCGPDPGVTANMGVTIQTDSSNFTTSSLRFISRKRNTNTDFDVDHAFLVAHGDLA